MNREERREQQRNNPNCIYCNSPIHLPHQAEGHKCVGMMLTQIRKQGVIIEVLLGLLDKSNAKMLELQEQGEWISLSERLPERGRNIAFLYFIGFLDTKTVGVTRASFLLPSRKTGETKEDVYNYLQHEEVDRRLITHWQYLPEEPRAKETQEELNRAIADSLSKGSQKC